METEPQESPAPYGGIMVQSLQEDNDRKNTLEKQTVEVNVNGNPEQIRPEAIFIRGVDSLSTKDIESFINYYLNYLVKTETSEDGDKLVYEQVPLDQQLKFRVQWINDSSVNIAFKTHEEAKKGLDAISITSMNPAIAPTPDVLQDDDYFSPEYLSTIVQERETKPYNPVIQFQKQTDLATRLGIEKPGPDDSSIMEEDESAVVLYTRQSFQSDRKVKNASVYSRYYLLHGEPERKPYKKRQFHRPKRNNNRRGRVEDEEEEDLFAHKLKQRSRDRSRDGEGSRDRDRSRSPMRLD